MTYTVGLPLKKHLFTYIVASWFSICVSSCSWCGEFMGACLQPSTNID